ncbi:fructose-1,6-bisphosphatase class 3 [Gordonibacter pamelaeae]|uniref:fructose-1,6-bisphosphatase n=1 Tax=Gordonibacter TaxID=644652 RepID=UPI000B3A6189|nr:MULTISPECIES: fructose-1,6-bisphosphatase [Gordonibacter]MDN4509668.1 fructose-1,6-bisphosphatase [Gordonibacter sp. RACS_AR49]OUO86206.1 fructose-bisphosphatase class III [Gordonibacter urolithinfaciens]GKG89647.1 fructose-1,6-bisphosphatase class 3 [Gordonibacter pamelaeae]
MDAMEKRYLELLSRSFPTAAKASAEIINLSAILNLPKGTEFFASDIHGEYEAFSHILRNGSGSIRLKIDDVFGDTLSAAEKRSLATLIYYPREKMELVLSQVDDPQAWYETVLPRLVAVCKRAAQKYTRSRVRKALPRDFAYIIEELMTENSQGADKKAYYAAIIDAVIRTDRVGALIEALCLLIQRLAIDHLHIIGDIYDRGPYPDVIMDTLMGYHSLDIQWGNHDIVWMGAALGQRGCIAHVVRNCARYGNLSILEDAYGINILPLAAFATSAYADDPCVAFGLKGNPDLPPQELEMNVKIQKAMAIIQFKVEAQLIDENPGFGLADRKLLDKIDHERGTVMLDGVEYALTDTVFPTVNPDDPYRLTPEEEEVMQRLEQAFTGCEKLQRHMRFFLEAGSLYKVYNGSLLFHACVPLNADGSLRETDVFGQKYKGRALYDVMERYVRAAFYDPDPEMRKRGRDLLWYMWLGEGSPLFAKSKMATFELYLIAEKEARKEVKNPFYTYLDDERVMAGVFEDFGMDPETSRIVCGHIPVKVKDGEDPVKCGGKVLTIDGGFSKAYQPTTGIAGYTLISNSYGFVLAAHEPLSSARAAVVNELDIHSSRSVVEQPDKRTLVADTDNGAELKRQIAELERLLEAYRTGEIAEGAM